MKLFYLVKGWIGHFLSATVVWSGRRQGSHHGRSVGAPKARDGPSTYARASSGVPAYAAKMWPRQVIGEQEVRHGRETCCHPATRAFPSILIPDLDHHNEGYIEDRQVGWYSINGLKNTGRVTFMETGPNLTQVTLFLHFQPPVGVFGKWGELLVGDHLERVLEEDLQRFAHMVRETPHGTLDPMSSHFLFQEKSADATGTATAKQNNSMSDDPMMTPQELEERRKRSEQEKAASEQVEMERETATEHESALLELARREQESVLNRQAEWNREEEQKRQAQSANETEVTRLNTEQHDPTLYTLGGRGAATQDTPLSDRDASNQRFPDYQRGPDSTSPKKALETATEIEKTESPWRRAIRGEEPQVEEEDSPSQE